MRRPENKSTNRAGELSGDLRSILAPGREYQSLYGYTFTVDSTAWQLSKGITLHVASVLEMLHSSQADGFLATLIHVSTTASPRHANNYVNRLKHLAKIAGGHITTASLINYRSTLDRRTESYLGTLRSFFYKWFDLGYPGIEENIVDLLKGWKLKGNIKGDAVQRRDPKKGPLTLNELIAFNEGAARAFEKGDIGLPELAIGLLISSTGRRPIQIAHMKLVDVEQIHWKADVEPKLTIRIPRAKQEGAAFRTNFKSFGATPELWQVLQAQRRDCIKRIEAVLGFTLEERLRGQLPLFPDMKAIRSVASISDLLSLIDSDRLHIIEHQVNDVLGKVVKVAKCYSERTGLLLKVSPTRFRYGLGTRAAQQGLGVAIISELLDHSDHQNAGVYVKDNPEHVQAIDEAVGSQLAVYARAFQGKLVDSEKDARRGSDPASRIRYRGCASATCDSDGPCAANVPIPCYTCMHFQPWLEGPHQAVYDDLVAERSRIRNETDDETMASVNDRTILAVEDVIRRCKRRREELAAEETA